MSYTASKLRQERFFLVPAFFLFILVLMPSGFVHAASITDGLTITVNREAVTASALAGALVEIKCNAGSYVTFGTTDSSGIVTLTNPVTLATLLSNAGTCIVGSNLDVRVSEDGYVTKTKLAAITLLGAANSFTFTGSDAVQFGHKATITREGDGAALTGATVGVGATVCIEAGTLGIYYCPVPLASDGASLSIAKTGYVTNTASSVSDRTTNADAQGTLAPSSIQFQVKIITADELGTAVTPTTITFDGTTATTNSGSTYYFAPSAGGNKVVAITKTGFIPSALTNTGLGNVSASTIGQTSITLGATSTSAVTITAGNSWIIKGLQYALKSVALKSELGGVVTNIANGSFNATSTDLAVTGSGGLTIIGSAVSSDTLYIAATGNAGGDDALAIMLSNVTVDGGTANTASLVIATTTDTSNLVNALTSQTTFGIGQATGALQNTTGFAYPLKVTLADELGAVITASTLTTETFGGVSAYTNNGSSAYFANSASAGALVIAKNGYVSPATTNTGLSSVTTNQIATTSITFSTGSALTSAVVVGANASAQGLPFAQKVTIGTELSEALLGTTVTAGSGATSCSVVSGTAYCPVPFTQDGVANDISISKAGYVTSTTGDTGDRTSNASAQQAVSVSGAGGVQYALKVVVQDSAGSPVTGATVTHGGVSAASVSSNSYYFNTIGAGSLIVSKSGFSSTDTTVDTGLANVGVTSSGQTAVTLTGSTPFTGNLSSGGSSATARGLIATVVASGGGSSGSGGGGSSGRSSSSNREIVTTQSQPTFKPVSNTSTVRNLRNGMGGTDVQSLQTFLIKENRGSAARALAKVGAQGTFSTYTKKALMEYQKSVGIVPATGYFGPTTRAKMKVTSASGLWW